MLTAFVLAASVCSGTREQLIIRINDQQFFLLMLSWRAGSGVRTKGSTHIALVTQARRPQERRERQAQFVVGLVRHRTQVQYPLAHHLSGGDFQYDFVI